MYEYLGYILTILCFHDSGLWADGSVAGCCSALRPRAYFRRVRPRIHGSCNTLCRFLEEVAEVRLCVCVFTSCQFAELAFECSSGVPRQHGA